MGRNPALAWEVFPVALFGSGTTFRFAESAAQSTAAAGAATVSGCTTHTGTPSCTAGSAAVGRTAGAQSREKPTPGPRYTCGGSPAGAVEERASLPPSDSQPLRACPGRVRLRIRQRIRAGAYPPGAKVVRRRAPWVGRICGSCRTPTRGPGVVALRCGIPGATGPSTRGL